MNKETELIEAQEFFRLCAERRDGATEDARIDALEALMQLASFAESASVRTAVTRHLLKKENVRVLPPEPTYQMETLP